MILYANEYNWSVNNFGFVSTFIRDAFFTAIER